MSEKVFTQRGISLVELMVGIAISLILLTGVLTVMLRVSTSGADSVQATRLNQQMRGTMDFVSKDLQRAGYLDWADVWDVDDDSTATQVTTFANLNADSEIDILDYYQAVTPAFSRFGEIVLQSFPVPGIATGIPTACSTNCDCVLFSYDLDQDGLQGVASASGMTTGQDTDNFELFGFRWNDGAVEQRTKIANVSDMNSCNSNGWQDLTDENITISGLAFSLSYGVSTAFDSTVYVIDPDGSPGPTMATSCTPSIAGTYPDSGDTLCLWRRKIDIALQGRLTSDPEVDVELNNSIKIKNDYLDSQP